MSRIFPGFISLLLCICFASGQSNSLKLKANQIVVIADSVFIAENDTTIILPSGTKYQLIRDKYVINKNFFSKVYSKAQI
ncbi:MAG: hypothetical protein GDA51_04880 [Ekhidna sp.]|nr:hypothetical protein [Ekhidna sp.]MBC6411373.1 hypothetical protein [Ekhidna sp.]MBC6425799.1 hypothetical protein [Ekhidna sp.]